MRAERAIHLLLTILAVAGVFARAAGEPNAFDSAVPHTNGLGMRFVPVPVPETKVLFSMYQTRVKDFRAFIRESGYVHMWETADSPSRMWSTDKDGSKQRGHSWEDPGFKQTEDHPVVGVSWHDAKAFCEWLTVRERAAARLPSGWEYRLPTDHEWSVAVGLVEEDLKKTPEEKDGKIKDQFPWGTEWPPPAGPGNYAGAEADDGHWPASFATITGYKDDYPRTAPVGSCKPNAHGIYDLGSNVLEWCEDLYKDTGYKNRVLRGASWYSRGGRDYLFSSYRGDVHPGYRFDRNGFRCVAGASSPER